MRKNVWHKLLFTITAMDKLSNVIHGDWCADMAYSVCVGKVWISSAATSAFYHFEDPHIRILPVAQLLNYDLLLLFLHNLITYSEIANLFPAHI